jgi:hypothetical protein
MNSVTTLMTPHCRYRGLNDYPFWNDDTSFTTPAARGALISEAMAAEAAVVRNATGQANPPMFTYLWSEMYGARFRTGFCTR